MSGGLVFVADNAITPIPDMKVDDLLKIYVSLGALAPEVIPRADLQTSLPLAAAEAGKRLPSSAPLAKKEPV
jgi:uncharacterized membrane protein